MAIKLGPSAYKIATFGGCVLAGSGLNYIGKALKVPGSSTVVVPLTAGKSLNADDLVELGVTGAILVYGYKHEKKTLMLMAGGLATGIVVNKALELAGAAITPITSYSASFRVSGAQISQGSRSMVSYDVHTQITKGKYALA